MAEVVKTFSNVSEAKAWVAGRISEVKSHLDNKQTSIFESLDRIGSDISTNNQKFVSELEELKAYREQTISLFGSSAANIAIIDNKISEIYKKMGVKDSSCIRLCWAEGSLAQLVESIGSVRLEFDTSTAIKVPLVPPVKNKPKLKLFSDNSVPVLPSKERYVTSPSHSNPVPPWPLGAPDNGTLNFQSESEYVITRLYSIDEPTPDEINPADSNYTEMSDADANYYVMKPPNSSSPPPPQLPPHSSTLPLQMPAYEDIDGFGEEENNPSIAQPVALKFPKYPTVVKCPEGGGSGCIMKPKTLCVNPANNNLYVVEKGNSRVQILTHDGAHVKFFADKSGSNKMSGPYGICIANNHVYVTQSTLNCVHVYTPNGAFVKKFGREGTKEGRFSLPSCLTALSPKKQILICDTGNNRVQIFDFSHNFARVLGSGQLLKPVDICCDSGNKVVVLDRGPKCIHVFAQCGDLLYSTVSFSIFKQLCNPLFMTLGPQGDIFLSDYSRNCVFVFSIDGAMQGQIGEEGVFVEPRGLIFDTSGRLVVLSCNHSGCLHFFDM